ncbi:putative protein tyrosine kinase [Trypoxylus dichotomus]
MLGLKTLKTLLVILVHFYTISSVAETIGQLPHCVDNTGQGLLLVSTLDGKLSALNTTGSLLWQIDTGTLLKSNIHNIELANNGEWLRLIPSLTGDSLLKSSFFYSHDIVIAGGKEIKTYGIGLHSGHLFYTCSLLGCQNETSFEGEIDNVLVIERNTLTVRAHEPRTGNERWNFSVGHHNIRIPSTSCFNANNQVIDFNVTAIIPEGLIIARKFEDKSQIMWKYKFDAPIVNVWFWGGRDLSIIDIFDIPVEGNDVKEEMLPAIYLAMYNKQLYITESSEMLSLIDSNVHTGLEATKRKSMAKIPWKPIPASSSAILNRGEQDVAALSVLYSSEYVNDNITGTSSGKATTGLLQVNWTYVVLALVTLLTFYILFGSKLIMVTVQDPVPPSPATELTTVPFQGGIENNFVSYYETTFETTRRLGRGGFGVVFEVTQKWDKHEYAVKRITLPDSNSEDRVLREVQALATLEHKNIIRYYNSWFEKPPAGWKYTCDNIHTADVDEYEEETDESEESSYCPKEKHKVSNAVTIDIENVCSNNLNDIPGRYDNTTDDFNVTFANNSQQLSEKDVLTPVTFKDKEKRNRKAGKNYLFIQMQLCKKESLRDWLEKNKERKMGDIILIFKQILDAVSYIHSKKLIHRDLKPSNIFFSMKDDIKVGDFGLVATTNDNTEDWNKNNSLLQSCTKGVGTELYMSPEQLEKSSYDLKVDIYSLGIIFFELLVPFGTAMERQRTLKNLKEHIYPEGFAEKYSNEHRLLEKMISNDPDARPTTEEIMRTAPLTSAC